MSEAPSPTLTLTPNDVDQLHTLMWTNPGGCSIHLGPGDFVLKAPVSLPSNTSLVGRGRDETRLILAERSNCHAITNHDHRKSTHNLYLGGFTLLGNGEAQERPENHPYLTFACGMYFKNTTHVAIRDVAFFDIRQTAVHFNNSRHLVVEDVETTRLGWSGLATSAASDLRVLRLDVKKAGLDKIHSGIHLDGGVGTYVEATVADTTGNGVMLDSSFGPFALCEVHARVRDCYRGVSLSGSSKHPLRHVAVNGEFTGNREAGIMVSNAQYVYLSKCTVENNPKYGVLLQGLEGARGCLVSRDCVVKNNGEDFAELHGSQQNWVFRTEDPASESVWRAINERALKLPSS